jgi:hypothetical protein
MNIERVRVKPFERLKGDSILIPQDVRIHVIDGD